MYGRPPNFPNKEVQYTFLEFHGPVIIFPKRSRNYLWLKDYVNNYLPNYGKCIYIHQILRQSSLEMCPVYNKFTS